ncbi:MAG: hypothetical protein RLY58_73 [Pseudomonadota bacterium]|jgi:hypothetical protein
MNMVDATLTRSRLRVVVYVLAVLMCQSLIGGSAWPLWVRLAAMAALASVALWQYRREGQVWQLDQLDGDRWRWQQQTLRPAGSGLSPQYGRLVAIRAVPYVLQLSFEVQQPRRQRVSLLVWQDQVSCEAWRRLQVLARFWVGSAQQATRPKRRRR